MTIFKDNEKQLIEQFEEVIKQEDLVNDRLKNYLYNLEADKSSIKDLFIDKLEIQSKKREIHKKLRHNRLNIH